MQRHIRHASPALLQPLRPSEVDDRQLGDRTSNRPILGRALRLNGRVHVARCNHARWLTDVALLHVASLSAHPWARGNFRPPAPELRRRPLCAAAPSTRHRRAEANAHDAAEPRRGRATYRPCPLCHPDLKDSVRARRVLVHPRLCVHEVLRPVVEDLQELRCNRSADNVRHCNIASLMQHATAYNVRCNERPLRNVHPRAPDGPRRGRAADRRRLPGQTAWAGRSSRSDCRYPFAKPPPPPPPLRSAPLD